MKISNYEEVLGQLVDMMIDLDVNQASLEIDIYLYINNDGTGKPHQFSNPGGNSWLDDDHITLYTDGPHYDDYIEAYDEDGNPIEGEDLRDYLEEYRSEYTDRARMLLNEAGIKSA